MPYLSLKCLINVQLQEQFAKYTLWLSIFCFPVEKTRKRSLGPFRLRRCLGPHCWTFANLHRVWGCMGLKKRPSAIAGYTYILPCDQQRVRSERCAVDQEAAAELWPSAGSRALQWKTGGVQVAISVGLDNPRPLWQHCDNGTQEGLSVTWG